MANLTTNRKNEKKGGLGIIITGELASGDSRVFQGTILGYDANGKLVAGPGVKFAGVADEEYIPPCAGEEKPAVIRYTATKGGMCWILLPIEGTVNGRATAYVQDSGTLTTTSGAVEAGEVTVDIETPAGFAWLAM